MNSINPFLEKTKLHPHKMAICDIDYGIYSFQDIRLLGEKTQSLLHQYKLTQNDSVLVALTPGPMLYGVLCGLVGHGVRVVFIEPWMPIERINHVIELTRPKAFLFQGLGRLWGARSPAIRKIPHWIGLSEILNSRHRGLVTADLSPEHPAYVVFSSGTTGAPKGIIRTHGFMQGIADLFETLEPQNYSSPDLVLFPNVALFHLGTGRGSIIIPKKWSKSKLQKTWQLAQCYRPETLSLNPAFLTTLLRDGHTDSLPFLERIIIGGALSDTSMLKEAFTQFPQSRFLHLYGGSEAEPVSFIDAKIAVKESQRRGFFQTLCIGEPIPQIRYQLREGILWVQGPNVAGEYIGDVSQNIGIKERDGQGQLWHCMSDRIEVKDHYFWFQGRANQSLEEFLLEQRIYQELKQARCFLKREGKYLFLIGEDIEANRLKLKKLFSELDGFIEAPIERDARHRSRINREKTLISRRKQ
jgi:acyl-coenzyme A synthetase/AMP-(fatty) acid ligase